MSEYLDTADAAKMIRQILKRQYPGVKFSVRIQRYSGGSSIDVSWTDGPTAAAVDALVKPFAGRGFDGMIDMQYSNDTIILADGTAIFGGTEGTMGSMGMVAPTKVELPEGARRVRTSAYVFTHRGNSPAAVKEALAAVVEQYGNQIGLPENLEDAVEVSDWDGHGYIKADFRDKDVTGEPGWNLHWSLGSVVGRQMQETAY